MEKSSRRSFLVGAAATGAFPLFNVGCAGFGRGRARQIAQGARIRVALIGCGCQMGGLIRRMGGDGNVHVVALVDPDPARGEMPPVALHWYDGLRDGIPIQMPYVDGHLNGATKREYLNFPPSLLEFERKYGLEKAPLAFMGSVFVGTKGAIWHCFHSSLRFFPRGIGRDFIKNRVAYQADEHVMEFLNAVREGREANTNFGYSVPLATAVLLGNVAARAGKKKLLWDGSRVTNDDAANAFLRTTYRKGWELA